MRPSVRRGLLPARYRNGIRVAVAGSAAPYGFTLTIWTSGAILAHANGLPTALDGLLFMLGAVCGFATVGALAYGSVRRPVTTVVVVFSLWRSFHVLSVAAAIGAASLVAHLLDGLASWAVGGLAATVVYLLGVGIHLAHESPPPGEAPE